ncbi:hypothetical protein J2X31_000961 [Flavobacterium arsenatis]|uniref:Porin n=1 Tax=Flavobacterium arsenatis TaxID=1484332 RepID=A0ABU1TLW2_9FLAO|nr:putative porin [Flavobacterium arsenatis]MDR6966961.1 hypothetical protein [Flavobacterium arsenatis]
MAKKFLLFIFLLLSLTTFAQRKQKGNPAPSSQSSANDRSGNPDAEKNVKPKSPKAPIDLYRVITLERDTTYIDTSLSIQKEYIYNYLRRDSFGLLAFANEGQTYQTLQFGLNDFSPFPEFGFKAKHFNFLEANQIKYYSVATPLTELYFKTVMEQGQSLDAFIAVNTSERLNFSIAYKGLRSLGKYVNQLSSTGNFRFTTSYHTSSKRYAVNMHITSQDMSNGENGGITNPEDFEGKDQDFRDRARLNVYFQDATSLLDGNRYFVDHHFRFNKEEGENNLYIDHQFNYENKFFEYTQTNLTSLIPSEPLDIVVQRFGDSYTSGNIRDKTRYNRMYNKLGATYENKTLGQFQFFVEDFRYNHYYNSILIFDDKPTIPSSIGDRINTVGGQYRYQKGNWNGKALYSNSISDQEMSNLDLTATYTLNEDNLFSFQYQNISKLPDHIYNLYQSSYKAYNWVNDFNNEKINNFEVKAETQWASASLQLTTLNNKLYFSDNSTAQDTLLVSPKQYGNTINYLSLKISKEIRVGKFALDNTILYQKVDQDSPILNVPELVTRNTLYFSDHFFKKAMFLQTGITFNYFTKYFANDYNPLIGEFYVQDKKEIGEFPMFDFFINAKIRQTRIYLKAEHFNSSLTGNDFYSAPSYPYRDFMVRFGLVWNFFQ